MLDSLVSPRAVVVEEGVLVARKPGDERRLLLNIELSEIRRVLSDIGGQRWKNLVIMIMTMSSVVFPCCWLE